MGTAIGLSAQIIRPDNPDAPEAPIRFIDPTALEQESYARLDRYIGEWTGTLIVTDSEGSILQLISLNQSYWWEDTVLKGLATFGSDQRLQYAFSETTVENGTIAAVIREGSKSKIMKATPTERGLIWTPDDPARLGVEQTSEYITSKDGSDVLVIQGFELVNTPPLEERMQIYAELVKQP